jgi:hypothetical protein
MQRVLRSITDARPRRYRSIARIAVDGGCSE